MAAAKRVKEKELVAKPDLKEALRNYFGFDSFKGEQEAIIHNLLSGNDTFVIMPTGGGKSVCYQLPALIMEGTAIIISPLIALMKNQVDAIRSLSHESVAHFLNSSLNKGEITAVKKDINAGKTKQTPVWRETARHRGAHTPAHQTALGGVRRAEQCGLWPRHLIERTGQLAVGHDGTDADVVAPATVGPALVHQFRLERHATVRKAIADV
jgi:hypothetical protein